MDVGCFELHGISAIWTLDFEFEVADPSPIPKRVVCMVAHDSISGTTLRLGYDQLGECPFKCDTSEVFVAYFASAEASCFLALGWPLPPIWLDLWAEEARMVNGSGVPKGGLLAVLKRHGLPVRDSAYKHRMQQLIGTGRWQGSDMPAILDYCQEDVDDTLALLANRLPTILLQSNSRDPYIAIGQAFARGRFMAECARMERAGLPVDAELWAMVTSNFAAIKLRLVEEVDRDFGCYEDGSFRESKFREYLVANNIPWPTLPSGKLALDSDTFKKQSEIHPQLKDLYGLRTALAEFRNNRVVVDPDSRVRTRAKPFASKTGRSQPSNSSFMFGLASWARGFMRAPPGHTLVYLDYASQEIAIAAGLSGDKNLQSGYLSGDPYLAFAKSAGLAPQDATADSHADVRHRCKQIVLGTQYGMGEETLAARAGVHKIEARNLLQLHLEAYPKFWEWTERKRNLAAGGLALYTPLGWRISLVNTGSTVNERSSGNWPIQSTGADIMRAAVILCSNAGVPPIATVHDALVFEFPIDAADTLIAIARAEMERAAEALLGAVVRVDANKYDYPNRYQDKRGKEFFDRVVTMAQQQEERKHDRGNQDRPRDGRAVGGQAEAHGPVHPAARPGGNGGAGAARVAGGGVGDCAGGAPAEPHQARVVEADHQAEGGPRPVPKAGKGGAAAAAGAGQ